MSPIPKPLQAAPRWATPPGVACIALGYGAIHGLMRWAASGTIGIDDAFETYYAQALAPGYQVRQPPLYDWMLNVLQHAVGTGVQSFLLLKYLLLVAAVVATHAVARRAITDVRLAAVAALSLSAIYQIGWNIHEGVTHTAALTALVPTAALAFMRVVERPTAGRGAALGLALGLGMLSKHGFPATVAVLAAGAALTPSVRVRLRAAPMLVAVAVAALCYAPYAHWLAGQERTVLAAAEATLRGTEGPGPALRLIDGLLVKPLLFLSPLWLLVTALAWAGPRPADPPATRDPDWAGFLGRATLAAAVGLALAAAAGAVTTLKERHLHALFLLTPVWLWSLTERFAEPRAAARRGLYLLAALAAVVLALREVGFIIPDEPFCEGRCRPMKPFEALEEVAAPVGGAGGTLVAGDLYVAGNLRRLLPEARIVSLETEGWTPPRTEAGARACMLLWDRDVSRPDSPFVAPAPGDGPTTLIEQSWPHPWRAPGWRYSRFAARVLDPADPRCANAP
jgi:hypothetical protein